MQHFEFLPHTADIRMRIEASTFEGLFHAALHGMNSVLHGDEYKGEETEYTLHISSMDKTTLLIDFLSDVLTACYENKIILNKMVVLNLDERSIRAGLNGYVTSDFIEDIKAVTYHEADVHQNAKGNWESVVIFDI